MCNAEYIYAFLSFCRFRIYNMVSLFYLTINLKPSRICHIESVRQKYYQKLKLLLFFFLLFLHERRPIILVLLSEETYLQLLSNLPCPFL